MNENELKSIERYFNKFNEDAASFNEFEANDFIKLLKNNGRNDDAIEVGNTFLQMAPSLKGYINQYGYALYCFVSNKARTFNLKYLSLKDSNSLPSLLTKGLSDNNLTSNLLSILIIKS